MLNFLFEHSLDLEGLSGEAALAGGILGGGMMAALMGMLIFMSVFMLAMWIYTSFAFVSIAKKTDQESPNLAWIPVIGPGIIAAKGANMPTWPLYLLIGALIPFIGLIFHLVFLVFFLIWMWKTFEAIEKPGWFAILLLIPIVNLIILGIAAWSD